MPASSLNLLTLQCHRDSGLELDALVRGEAVAEDDPPESFGFGMVAT